MKTINNKINNLEFLHVGPNSLVVIDKDCQMERRYSNKTKEEMKAIVKLWLAGDIWF